MESNLTTKRKMNKFLKLKKHIILLFLVVLFIVISSVILLISFNKKDVPMCMVRFETNGGSEIFSQDIKCGEYANVPSLPIKEGFSFENWYYNDNVFDFDNTVINENIILTAKWKANENTEIIKIHFDTDGGSKINDIEISKGSLLVPPLNPKKDGYIFTYWYLDNNKFDFFTKIEKEITLKAGWKKEKVEENNNDNNNNDNDNDNENISNKECVYEMKESSEEGIAAGWIFDYGEDTQINSFFGFYSYDYEACRITYKTDDKNILTVNSTGLVSTKNIGTTNLYVCVVDKKTDKELDCYKIIANVDYEHGTEKAITDGKNLLNAIDGYYWYLDGYKYAYIHPNVIPWYDHEILDWTTRYIDLVDGKFVTSEDTGVNYNYSSSNIHNKFLVNPIEFAYTLISRYNMHVVNNKLYITVNGNTYTFNKGDKKNNIPTITLDKSSITVNENEEFSITVNISPSFVDTDFKYDTPWITTSNGSYVIASCNKSDNQKGKVTFKCMPVREGNSTITVTDTISCISKTINVVVNNVPIKVSDVILNKQQLNMLTGDSEVLNATVNPYNADNKQVIWSSSDVNVATVNSNGKVVAKGKGTAIITVSSLDGDHKATCEVKVTNSELSAKGTIGYTISTSNSGISGGISATINATGGSGKYTYYYIKLYKDGELISETVNTNSNQIIAYGYKNGTYIMEFVVKDSDGNEYKGISEAVSISM